VCTVRQGNYFRIPENPADIEQMWGDAEILTTTRLPAWLAPEDASSYRYLGCASMTTLAAGEHDGWRSEREALEAAGFIIDQDPQQGSIHQLYMPAPSEDVWSIGIYSGPSPFDLCAPRGVHNPVLTRDVVSDVPATFVADPFMIQANGSWNMFFEVMNWHTGKGEIGLAQSQDGFAWTYQQIVLAEPFHLSYPYVFAWKGEYYMIPESYQSGWIRLYKARNFPTQWSLVAQLLEGPYLVDPSIFRYGDKWWLFTETNPEVKHDCLRLYFADELAGPWVEHPKSPVVKENAQIARPGGRVLAIEGQIFRYAQDCSVSYGSNVRAFKVTELSTKNYAEEEVVPGLVLAPSGSGWNADGMHHVDAHRVKDSEWIACVDGRRAPKL
jgi:hypothetical protein